MQIRVSTNSSVQGGEELSRKVEDTVADVLLLYSDRIMGVEVHLSDENAGKGGASDKRCTIEVRITGQHPVAVTHHGSSLEEAYGGAAHKMSHLISHKLGRLDKHKGNTSMGGAEAP
jgi:hypothetical protein